MRRLAVLCVGAVLALGSSKAFADDLYYGQGIARGGCYVPPHHTIIITIEWIPPPIVLSPYGVSPTMDTAVGLVTVADMVMATVHTDLTMEVDERWRW